MSVSANWLRLVYTSAGAATFTGSDALGPYFLHERQALARSWRESCVASLLQLIGVSRIRADQCRLGQQNLDGDPLKKPTGLMSKSDELLSTLERRCFRPPGGRHAKSASARQPREQPSFRKRCAARS